MPTAYFSNSTDKRIGNGTYTYNFNPSGDVTGAEAQDVRFDFKLDYNNGASVDLDRVQIWIQSPDGDKDRIYYNGTNAAWWVDDNDDHNDSDDANDWDIDFSGYDSKSTTDDLKGAKVTGTWKLIIENDTGKTLDLDGLRVWVDYKKPEDYAITDLVVVGGQQVDQPVQIKATVKNVGELYKFERVDIEYLVNDKVIGTSALTAGLLVGQEWTETEWFTFDKIGANTVTARIKGSPDTISSNNSLTKTFIFEHNDPDLAVTDIRLTGNGEAGSTHYITADITNVGNATHTGDVLLEYLVDGEVIGTQTIGGLGVNVMLPGTENSETEAHFMSDTGAVDIEVRIANPHGDDYSSSNNSRTETFSFTAPEEAPDLAITDVRVIGGWEQGEVVNLRAHIENNGTESWNVLGGLPYIEYFVRYEGESAWETVGGDTLTSGVITGFSEWVHTDFTLEQAGPFEVKVKVSGRDYEANTTNNVWSESAGHSRTDAPQKNLENSASDVKLAAFLARAVYGMGDVPQDADYDKDTDETNGLHYDYTGYLAEVGLKVLTDRDFGDLFRPVDELAKFYGGTNDEGVYEGGLFAGDQGLASSNPDKWQAQGLVSEGYDEDGKKMLTLAFRGTDPVDKVEALFGQAWTGDGLYDYYESMRPLIEAAIAYANDSANGIEKFLVTGHSLGGATADAFALVDAHRLKSEVDLTVVSLASPGIDRNFLDDTYLFKGMFGQHDRTDLYDLLSINAYPFYIGVSHYIDPVTYPYLNPLDPIEKVPNFTLLSNLNMDDKLTAIHTPNIDNDDLPGQNFGAGHNSGLYWANLSQIMSDSLKEFHAGHRISVGIADYSQILDMNGQPFGVFTEYVNYDAPSDDPDAPVDPDHNPDDDSGQLALIGDDGKDFILGFSGDDDLRGKGGNDLLSGGTGDDTLMGGAGDDMLDGDEGFDLAVYAGSFFDYIVETFEGILISVSSAITSDAGVDQLFSIEALKFGNGLFDGELFTTTAIVDADEDRGWESFTETFDQEGERIGKRTVFDDGRVDELTYVDSMRSLLVSTDEADAYGWQSQTWSFDATGTLINRTRVADDRRETYDVYEYGELISSTVTDVEDDYNWTTIESSYVAGELVSRMLSYDDGREKETNFIEGVTISTTFTDMSDLYSWHQKTSIFDASGQVIQKDLLHDDGRLLETIFEDGQLAAIITTDTLDQFDWASSEVSYENGEQRLFARTDDDGTLLEIEYANGLRVSRTSTDIDDAYSWRSKTDYFAEDGEIIEHVRTVDDGRRTEFHYEDGTLISTLTMDIDDEFDWKTLERAYEGGALEVEKTTYDDGRVKEMAYENGIRALQVTTDTADAFTWQSVVVLYDENGDEVSRTNNYDDGSSDMFLI